MEECPYSPAGRSCHECVPTNEATVDQFNNLWPGTIAQPLANSKWEQRGFALSSSQCASPCKTPAAAPSSPSQCPSCNAKWCGHETRRAPDCRSPDDSDLYENDRGYCGRRAGSPSTSIGHAQHHAGIQFPYPGSDRQSASSNGTKRRTRVD